MKISLYWPWELEHKIEGVAVAIDVWCATTNIVTLVSKQPRELLLTTDEHVERILKQKPSYLFAGESAILPAERFDATNLPRHVASLNAWNRDVLFLSANGTRTIAKCAEQSDQPVLVAAFTNITAVSEHIRRVQPTHLTIVPSGNLYNRTPVDDDWLCARSLADLLQGKPVNWEDRLRRTEWVIRRFYQPVYTAEDLQITLSRDSSTVVPKCILVEPGLVRATTVRE